jgi:endonuclease VIII
MPEGDTILRIARSLSANLVGGVIDHFEVKEQGPIRDFVGRTVDGVEARGKHLLLHVEGGWSLRVHLGMHGRWRSQPDSFPRPRSPTALIVADGTAWICSRAYRAELMRTVLSATHPRLRQLGPDILAEAPAIEAMVERAFLPGNAQREIGDLLLDQHVAAGIGNVYKREALFAARVHPRSHIAQLGRDTLHRIFAEAARLMKANLETRQRTSVPLRRRPHPGSPRMFVYGRAGRPCLDCGAPVERIVQGDAARSTFCCPQCQRIGSARD